MLSYSVSHCLLPLDDAWCLLGACALARRVEGNWFAVIVAGDAPGGHKGQLPVRAL